jgi:DNA-binding transcriptional LysR family regulator
MLTPFDLELFVAIADTGSLTAASRVCGVTRATIARRLTALEERLGVPLINRTTRDLNLTEAGIVYFDGCRETLTLLRRAEAAVHELGGHPRGQLRISCPILRVEQIIGPLVSSFAHTYPEVDVQVNLTSEPCNPLVDGFDIAVQIGFEKNAALIARCLLRESYTLMASPEYLRRRGTPRRIEELVDHDCIIAVRANGVREAWPLAVGGAFTIERPRLMANAPGLIRIAAMQGVGIGLIAHSLVRDDLAAGALVPVLEGEVGQTLPISLLYAAGSKLSPKIRAFVDFATTWVERLVTTATNPPAAAAPGPAPTVAAPAPLLPPVPALAEAR